MDPALIADAVLGVLLIAAIAACVIVDRRLAALRAGQDGLKPLIAELDRAVGRAERALGGLAQTAQAAGGGLDERAVKARALADELALMIEAGDNLARRLETARPAAAAARPAAPVTSLEAMLKQAR